MTDAGLEPLTEQPPSELGLGLEALPPEPAGPAVPPEPELVVPPEPVVPPEFVAPPELLAPPEPDVFPPNFPASPPHPPTESESKAT